MKRLVGKTAACFKYSAEAGFATETVSLSAQLDFEFWFPGAYCKHAWVPPKLFAGVREILDDSGT